MSSSRPLMEADGLPSKTFGGSTLSRAIIVGIALLLLTRNVDGWHQWNGAMYSQFARNHIAYGLEYTKLYCTWGQSQEPPLVPQRYLNHPPLIAMWAAIPMSLFGDEEWVGRSVPIAATLGCVCLLMVVVSRLQCRATSLLAGLFYVSLPITSYFGRMLDHVPLVQFFSLLMLHGYLQWSGSYGSERRRGVGALWYTVGAVLGVGTGWGTLIMAGLICGWHVGRTALRRDVGLCLWLVFIPGVSLLAVVLHILWGCDWDWRLFGSLFWTRTLGPTGDESRPWVEWLSIQWRYLRDNVTVFGVTAVLVCLVAIPLVLRVASDDSPLRRVVGSTGAQLPFAFLGLHGLIYVVAFKNQSWTHDYWQYFLGPSVAVSLSIAVMLAHALLARVWPSLATVACALLVAVPMPAFASALDRYHRIQQMPRRYMEMFEQLGTLVPRRAAVMTSRNWPEFSETISRYTNRWPMPQIAYYANRPLIHVEDLDEILANECACPAYVLEMENDEGVYRKAELLMRRYESVPVGRHHLIVLLDQPIGSGGDVPADAGSE